MRSTVSVCSIGAQGLWLRIMMLMHDSERRGYLTLNGSPMPPRYAARQCSVTPDEYDALLAELLSVKALSTSSSGTIFSPEMVAEFGKKTGNAKRQANYRERKRQEKEAEKEKKRNANVTRNVTPPSREHNGDNSEVIIQSSISEKEKDKTIVLSSKKNGHVRRKKQRASPISDNFVVTDPMLDWAKENVPDVSVSLVTQKFINHFKSKSGAGRLSADWTAQWKNYLLTNQQWIDQEKYRPGESPPTTPISVAAEAESPPRAFAPPEPLPESARRNQLVILRGIVRDSSFDSIEALEDHFTPDDWAWLIKNLKNAPEKTGES